MKHSGCDDHGEHISDFVDLESSSAVPVDLSYQHLNVIGGLPDTMTIPDPLCKSTPPLGGSARQTSVKVSPMRSQAFDSHFCKMKMHQ